MKFTWNVLDRVWVFVPFMKRRIRGTIVELVYSSGELLTQDYCKIRVDGFVEKYLVCSSSEIGGRLVRKKIKDEPADIVDKIYHVKMTHTDQRIAELENQLNLSKELGRKLANHNADLNEENMELQKDNADMLELLKQVVRTFGDRFPDVVELVDRLSSRSARNEKGG